MTDETLKLKKEEQEAVELWASGKSMTEAYCIVMRKKGYDIDTLPKQTLNKRVQRFFASDKIKEAMVLSGRNREQRVRQEVEKKLAIKKYTEVAKRVEPKIKEAAEAEKKAEEKREGVKKEREIAKEANNISSFIDKVVLPNVSSPKASGFASKVESVTQTNEINPLNIADKTAKDKWLESLMITEEPSAISVYGTGQFVMYHAVSEMMKRDRAIKMQRSGTGVFDKNGSVFTPLILNALKTAASMIIPFVQTQDSIQDKGAAMAVTLLGLMQDKIEEDPDAYTAPIPPTAEMIDVTNGRKDED
jgi:uncharacterized protein YggL (DUF469 family)